MVLGFGLSELLMIGLVLLVVVGPDRLPQFLRTAGRYYGQVRRASDELRRAFTVEADRVEAQARLEKLEERRKRAHEFREKAMEEAGSETVAQETESVIVEGDVPAEAAQDPETPATMVAPSADSAPTPEPSASQVDLPNGITSEEWEQLSPSVQALLRKADKAEGGA